MPKYVVIGSIRVVVEADSAEEAEDILSDFFEEAECVCGDMLGFEEITVGDAVEVGE